MDSKPFIVSVMLLIVLSGIVGAVSISTTAAPRNAVTIRAIDAAAPVAVVRSDTVTSEKTTPQGTSQRKTRTAADIVLPRVSRSLFPQPSTTIRDILTRPERGGSTDIPPPPRDGNCEAPEDDDALDDAPELLWGGYAPDPVTAGQDFIITLCATDDVGVDRIRVRLGEYDANLDCDGARSCVRRFTTRQDAAGVFDYRAYAYDTLDNLYLDILPVTVQPLPCEDTDRDSVCDADEEPSCIGQTMANLPRSTTCLRYAFERGCHVSHADDGTTVCTPSLGIQYVCADGHDPGDDVFQQDLGRYCGVNTGMCDGGIGGYGENRVEDLCGAMETCMDGNSECQPMDNPPRLEPVGDYTVREGEVLTIMLSAFDPDADILTFSSDAAFGSLDMRRGIFRYAPGFMDAGVYRVTFTVSDGRLTDSVMSTITVVNTPQPPPSITLVDVTPNTAYTDTVLTCTPSGWVSRVGAAPDYRYRWLNNGVEIIDQTTSTLDCNGVVGCDKHDAITCEVTPIDPEGEGMPRTDSVTIQNSLPVLAGVFVTPPDPSSFVDVSCICGGITDVDGDMMSCNYFEIYRNGMLYASGLSAVLPASVTERGDRVECRARPFDGEAQGSMVSSAIVTIVNYLPIITSVAGWGMIDGVSPFNLVGYLREESPVTATANDPDGDRVTVTCSEQAAYEVAECAYNFTDVISGPLPPECSSHPESGCFGVRDNGGPLRITMAASDGRGGQIEQVDVDVRLRWLPPIVMTNDIEVTEGDVVTCPCTGMDPDGGRITDRYCGEPFNGPGNLSAPYLARYADVGRVFNAACILTDDEGQRSARNYTIRVNAASYNITLRSRVRDEMGIVADESRFLEASTTRLLIEDNELWQYGGAGPACTAMLCFNTPYLSTINDYFDNFRSRISEEERLFIYGPDWPILMDNRGFGDANHEITTIIFDITRV